MICMEVTYLMTYVSEIGTEKISDHYLFQSNLIRFFAIFTTKISTNLDQKKTFPKKLFCHLVTENSLKTKFCLLRGTMQDIIFALWYILTRKNIDRDTKGTGNDDIISEPIFPKNPR